ncbi:hypothetical protein H0E87_029731, partial [Populus deltoides]
VLSIPTPKIRAQKLSVMQPEKESQAAFVVRVDLEKATGSMFNVGLLSSDVAVKGSLAVVVGVWEESFTAMRPSSI